MLICVRIETYSGDFSGGCFGSVDCLEDEIALAHISILEDAHYRKKIVVITNDLQVEEKFNEIKQRLSYGKMLELLKIPAEKSPADDEYWTED
jgi:hypothetical protein